MPMTTPTIEDIKEASKKEVAGEKAIYEVAESSVGNEDTKLAWLPSGIVSFAEFDAMEEAKQAAIEVKNSASLFKAMVDNILELEPDEEMDKSQMIVDLSQEFAERVQATKEVNHLKEVFDNELKAIDEDFKGGCSHCGFSTVDELKELNECPYCHGELDGLKEDAE